MSQSNEKKPQADAGITDVLGSVAGLAAAGTRFTIKQMQNAIGVFTDPQGVVNNVKESIDSMSEALNKPADSSNGSEPAPTMQSAASAAGMAAEPQNASDMFSGRKL